MHGDASLTLISQADWPGWNAGSLRCKSKRQSCARITTMTFSIWRLRPVTCGAGCGTRRLHPGSARTIRTSPSCSTAWRRRQTLQLSLGVRCGFLTRRLLAPQYHAKENQLDAHRQASRLVKTTAYQQGRSNSAGILSALFPNGSPTSNSHKTAWQPSAAKRQAMVPSPTVGPVPERDSTA